MNKNAIQSFTQWAKIQLTSAIKQKAFEYGITENMIDESVSIVNGRVLSQVEQKQRETLINKVKEEGYTQVIEEVTYTWFNRFIALRFMEVNGYLPTRVRVFSDEYNQFNPQILKEALTIELDNINKDLIIDYLDKNNTEDLYKYLLVSQCNALNKIIPVLFERISNYSELLFPDNLLKKNSVIEHLVTDIPEEDWKEQVQILGWIYQFYIADKKDETFASKKTITKNTLAAVTQLFTPDWIVRYMTENSLGRLWLESNPNSSIKQSMKYYVDDAKQEEEVQRKLDEIKYKNVNPEDIRIIEPCCGSGHILCYIFDLLYKIYEESGYRKSEIPTLILEKNIYGLDIDKRASQLAYFSLLMKARSVDSRFFSREKIAKPKVLEIVDSQNILDDDYLELMENNNFSNNTMKTAKYLVETFKNAKVIGSLLKVDKLDYKSFIEELKIKRKEGPLDLFSTTLYNDLIPEFIKIARLAIVLSKKYDVMITNPPYIGISTMEQPVKDYANKHYPNSKTDMFAMFMETDFLKTNGFMGMINMSAWLTLPSFMTLRKNIISKNICSLIYLGTNAFEEIRGEVVKTTSFIMRNLYLTQNSVFLDLSVSGDKKNDFYKNECRVERNVSVFNSLPEYRFYFKNNNELINSFNNKKLSDFYLPLRGFAPTPLEKYSRYWFEVEYDKICLNASDLQEALNSNKMWFLYNKGGKYRKWYGNLDTVVLFKRLYLDRTNPIYKKNSYSNAEYYFQENITWPKSSFGRPNFRFNFVGSIIGDVGPCIVRNNNVSLFYLLGFLNSDVAEDILLFLNNSQSFQTGDLSKMPLIFNNVEYIEEIVKKNIELSKIDWDYYEYSVNYCAPSFSHSLVEEYAKNLIQDRKRRNELLNIYTDEINLHFTAAYNFKKVQNKKKFKFDEINYVDIVKNLISYFIGVNLGRYSLEGDGLIYAGGTFDWSKYKTIIPDKDNIIPICDDEYFEDDLCARVIDSIKKIYGEDTLEENLQFIANALGGNGTSREIIRNYLLNDFYKDHLKIYQKRPIYWMLDSGKKNGFKALIYMHRYTPDLLAKIRTDYVHEQQERYRTQIENLDNELLHLEGSNRLKAVKKLEKIKAQAEELLVFEEKLHHLADQMISIDLDDGVVVNYAKFNGILSIIK